jgi:hypothetical protein
MPTIVASFATPRHLCSTHLVLRDLIQNGLSLPDFEASVMLLVVTMTTLVDVTAPSR